MILRRILQFIFLPLLFFPYVITIFLDSFPILAHFLPPKNRFRDSFQLPLRQRTLFVSALTESNFPSTPFSSIFFYRNATFFFNPFFGFFRFKTRCLVVIRFWLFKNYYYKFCSKIRCNNNKLVLLFRGYVFKRLCKKSMV